MRADLFALTPEAVAQLSNRGLVKRAEQEIAAGGGPSLEESADGRVLGRCRDGAVATLPPGVSLAEGSCTCGSAAVCRHRVAVALAYRDWRTHQGGADTPAAVDPWWPGAIDDETLASVLGHRAIKRAATIRARGCDITLTPARPDTPAEAHLTTVSVRMLVPDDLAYARCTCRTGSACEHVALAVWAFRIAVRAPDATQQGAMPQGSTPEATRLVYLMAPVLSDEAGEGDDDGDTPGDRDAAGHVGEPALVLSRAIVLEGAVNLSASFSATIARARARTADSGAVWLSTLIHDVDGALRAYRERSARYSAQQLAVWLAEVAARVRAARHAEARSAPAERRMMLGIGESPETPLGHTWLVSLGGRVFADGAARGVELLFAEPESATVLVARKQWTFKPNEPPLEGSELAGRALWSGARVGEVARAQIITQAGVRLADRQLRLPAARRGETAVVEQRTPWSDLPSPILVRDLAAHAAAQTSRPPTCLRPRVLADAIHVIDVGRIHDVAYAPGRQTLIASLEDVGGTPFLIAAPYRSAAPHALDCLADALSDRAAPVRQVSGELRMTSRGFELSPIGLFAHGVIVPDLARPSSAAASQATSAAASEAASEAASNAASDAASDAASEAAPAVAADAASAAADAGSDAARHGLARLPAIHIPQPPDPLGAAVLGAWSRIEEVAHRGMLRLQPAWIDATRASAERLRELGLIETAATLDRLAAAVGAAIDDAARRSDAVSVWETAAIRLMALSEALETPSSWPGRHV
jgi:hypothetical protein